MSIHQMTIKDGDTTVKANRGYDNDGESEFISFREQNLIGSGNFGRVFRAKILPSNTTVAIKRVIQQQRYKNRELEIMRQLRHPNIITLIYYFFSVSPDDEEKDLVLHLVLEYLPETAARIIRYYHLERIKMPLIMIKLYVYQLLLSLSFVHSFGICHRDIKPHNLLVEPETGILKLCDFGSAKKLVDGESNVAYICSRFYRAPELVIGATKYTESVDVWSSGCVIAEFLNGTPIFWGKNFLDQFVQIVKILGTPTPDEMKEMKEDYVHRNFPGVNKVPWSQIFAPETPSSLFDLLEGILVYKPNCRISAKKACEHEFFRDLFLRGATLPNGNPLPVLLRPQ